MDMNDETRDLIIIGGGPAGYTAALYAARANLEPLVIEGFNWGGQLMITSDVENYPGYPEGVMGPEMMAEFRRQAERFGTEFVTDDVTRVDFSERPFRVWVEDEEYRARSVIVATGASARWLGLESEERLKGRGVSACATCDGAFFRDKHIVVVGALEAVRRALHQALVALEAGEVDRAERGHADLAVEAAADAGVELVRDVDPGGLLAPIGEAVARVHPRRGECGLHVAGQCAVSVKYLYRVSQTQGQRSGV